MNGLLARVSGALSRLSATYPSNPRVALFQRALNDGSRPVDDGPALAIQSVEDPFYFALFGAIVAEIRRHRRVRGELVVIRATSGAIGVGWQATLQRSVPLTWILSTQWVRAFSGLADRIAFRSHSWRHPLHDVIDGWRSLALWHTVRRRPPAPDFALQVRGVEVGDLICDTYLRFRPSPRFDVADPFVLRLIWQAHCAIRRARTYFRRVTPTLYLTSYSTYVEHGVPVRVALQEGVRVCSFGSLTRFHKELTLRDWFHTANCEGYRNTFAALDRQDERLAEAAQQLDKRLSGGIDAATSYMRVSAYAGAGEPVPADVRGAVVVFLHDFYDSPHIYPDIVFGDFWAWACFTIDTLSKAGHRFFLKPHPNQVQLSSDVLEQLKARYPALRFLKTGITNAQLARAGMACGVTVYGTVAHELAYLGVPTVACARHPHASFDFCRTARDPQQYATFLRECVAMPLDVQAMRREALAFYYMHNLHGDPADLELRAAFIGLWKACQDPSTAPDDVLGALARLRTSPHFERCILALLETPRMQHAHVERQASGRRAVP